MFPISANAFRLAFNRARKKAGLEHFRFHDTRHERVSTLVEAGWSDTAVMALSGHKDPKSLKRYANLQQRAPCRRARQALKGARTENAKHAADLIPATARYSPCRWASTKASRSLTAKKVRLPIFVATGPLPL